MLQFFADLPWYVRAFLVAGGSMISGFSSQLPDALQEAGLFTGLALASLGLVTFIWHALNERRIRLGRGRLTLEPSTLLPVFTVIALVGVLGVCGCLIWQATRASVASTVAKTEKRPRAGATILSDDDGAVKWERNGYLFGASGDGKGVRFFSFQATGRNESDEFIHSFSGYFKSEITGREFPVLANVNGTLMPAADYGIPARHQFMIGARFSESGISAAEFLRDFGRLTFVFKYGTHTYTKHFAPEQIRVEVERTERDLLPKPLLGVAGFQKLPL